MKKKIISTVLAFTMIVMSLAGCNGAAVEDITQNAEDILTAIEDIQEFTNEITSGEKEIPDVEEEEVLSVENKTDLNISPDKVEKLREIADANGIDYEDLNVEFDDEGYVTFLGHQYSDMEIHDEDDVLLSLEEIGGLIGLDGVSLDFERVDESPISKMMYYTFYQVKETEVKGEIIPVEFFNNLIKVAVNQDGKVAAVSTYINHNEAEEVSEQDILEKDEVIEYAKSIVDTPENIIEDATKLVYWEDTVTVSAFSTGKRLLVYLVFLRGDVDVDMIDDEDEDSEESSQKVLDDDEEIETSDDQIGPTYTAIVFSALKYYTDKDNDEYRIMPVTTFSCSGIDEFEDGDYTSLYFFEGKEDAGEYTYTLSLDWVKDAYSEYQGPDTMEVKVPVMYEKSTGLYYLADYNRSIVMANYCDFAEEGPDVEYVNPVVTKTPEDLDSWGFLKEPSPQYEIEEYFFDSNYVVGVYNNMLTTYDLFHERYGFNGVDTTGLPIISLVYTFDYEYPEKISDFMYNAACGGQFGDWEYIVTSPSLAACISPTVMGHEFTHGVNQQLTSSQYFNQPGALMESYADIIGEELAILYANDPIHTPWVLGGDYCEILRNMGKPQTVYNPRYIGGADYIPETVEEFGAVLDHGGVHTNSGVTNYLAYRLTHEEEVTLEEGEEILEVGDNLDMWFETLYLATYVSDFYDVAHFLTFTKTVTGLSDGKQALVGRLLREHGMFGDCEEFRNLLSEEEHVIYKYMFTPDKEDFFDKYEVCVSNVCVNKDGSKTLLSGQMVSEDGRVILSQSSMVDNAPVITIIDKEAEEYVTARALIVTPKNAIADTEIKCNIKEVSLTSSDKDKFAVPLGEKITQLSKETDASAKYLLIDGEDDFTKYGKYIVFTQTEETGEYNMYLITVAD